METEACEYGCAFLNYLLNLSQIFLTPIKI